MLQKNPSKLFGQPSATGTLIHLTGGNVNGILTLENCLLLIKLKVHLTVLALSNFTPPYLHKRKENYVHMMYINVHSRFIHKNPKLGIPLMSTST